MEKHTDEQGETMGLQMLTLFMQLWPGDLEVELLVMNSFIQRHNKHPQRKVPLVSLQEYLIFLGVFL